MALCGHRRLSLLRGCGLKVGGVLWVVGAVLLIGWGAVGSIAAPADDDAAASEVAENAAVPPSYNVRVRRSIEPIDLRVGPQLFIDDYLVAQAEHLTRVTHSPKRVGNEPVLGWQAHVTQPYVTVLRDDAGERFRMWYDYDKGAEASIAYAESDDGIHWELPQLDILGPDNRVLKIGTSFQGGYGVSVVDDGPDSREPLRRYKLAYWGQKHPWPDGDPGVRVAFSPDGIHWTVHEVNPVLRDYTIRRSLDDPRRAYGVGDIVDVFFDPLRRRYGACLKTPAIPADGLETGPRANTFIRRLVSASCSEDFVNWERPWRIIVPEDRDKDLLEFYSAGGTIARGPLLISFVRMLHDDWAAEPGGSTDGVGYTTLATSRDGVHWERHDDVFFDRSDEPDAWDRAMTWVGSAVPVGDELYLYYGGYRHGHKIAPKRERQIGLAKIPTDRFVSRTARGDEPGRLVTPPLRVRAGVGSRFVLNADAAGGRIRVQVLDEDGTPIPGFSFLDAVPITGDGVRLPVEWYAQVDKAEPRRDLIDLARLDNKTIHLEFEITNGDLYGFDLERGRELPLRLGAGPHLFVDDHLLAEQDNLVRATHSPTKLERPALPTDQQPGGHASPGALEYDADRDVFKWWHWIPADGIRSQLYYRESADPSDWSAPGQVVLKFDGYGFDVFDEGPDFKDAQRRYKLLYFVIGEPPMGIHAAFSPDGTNWTRYAGNPLLIFYPENTPGYPLGVGDIVDPYWDPFHEEYGLICKMMSAGDEEFGMTSRTTRKGGGIRLVGTSRSSDFVCWKPPRRIIEPDYRDEGVMEFYCGPVVSRGDLLICFMRVLRDDLGDEGRGYTVLCTSRDGRHWTRFREPFLDRSCEPGSYDFAMSWISSAACKGDTEYFSFVAHDGGHKTGHRQGGIAQFPRHRYVARESRTDAQGRLRTPLLVCRSGPPSGLWLNVAPADGGSVAVRVLDASGSAIPGFERSKPVTRDGVAVPVEWAEAMSRLGTEPFRLEFLIENAALFGFDFAEHD